MPVSEDGVPYGSIDVSKLDEIEPKSDEAKAALDRLKADRDAGNETVAADEKRLNEGAVEANPLVDETPTDDRDQQGVAAVEQQSEGEQAPSGDQAGSQPVDSTVEHPTSEPEGSKSSRRRGV